jgi:putative ABC transport system permease protein
VASALIPAVRASRVSPLAAMRDVAIERTTRLRIRIVLAVGVTVLGALSLISGVAGDGGIEAVGLGVFLVFVAAVLFGPVFARPTVRLLGAPISAAKGMTGELARENAARNPKRTAATASALMIGVGIIAFFLAFNSSLRASIDDVVDEQFVGDFAVNTGSFGFGSLPPELSRRIAELPEVDVATGLRGVQARVDGGNTFATGVDPEPALELFDIAPSQGTAADLAEPDTIAVFDGRAEDKGWSVGDEIEVVFPQYGPTTLRIAMIYDNKELAGDYTIGFRTLDRYVPDPADFAVFIRLADGVDPAAARPALERVTDDYPTGELLDVDEFKDAQAEQFTPILGLVTVLMLLTILIAVLGIMNTLALSVLERTRELGLLRAVGATRSQIRTMIRWESVVIAVLGSTIGLGLGLFFAWSIGQALEEDGFTTYQIPYAGVAVVVIVSALFGMLAALYPAWRAGRLDVLDAIASE